MLYLYGLPRIIENLSLIAEIQAEGGSVSSNGFDQLRSRYLTALEVNQPYNAVNWNNDVFEIDDEGRDRLYRAFTSSRLNDLYQDSIIGKSLDLKREQLEIKRAKAALYALLQRCSNFAAAFALTIHSVFIRESNCLEGSMRSHGGSSSLAIGAIWMAMTSRLEQRDLEEMYIHELTHHLLFIDELVNPHFDYERIAERENFTRSAILQIERPMDKVLHSIVVATEIIRAREAGLIEQGETALHPRSEKLADSTLASIQDVLTLPNRDKLVSTHACKILEDCQAACEPIATVHA